MCCRDSKGASINSSVNIQDLQNIASDFLKEYNLLELPSMPESSVNNWEEEWRRYCHNHEVGTVFACSILGSILSQEIVKAISRTGRPGDNVFVFTGQTMTARAFPVAASSVQ